MRSTGRTATSSPSRFRVCSRGGALAPTARGCVGVHSTNFSPISDWGRMEHSASLRQPSKPGSVISMSTEAVCRGVTSRSLILPTLTPAIFTSSPGMTEKALRNSASTR